MPKTLHLIQIHYHLKSGGVRVVMENIIQSLLAADPKLKVKSTVLAGSGHFLSLPDDFWNDRLDHKLFHVEQLNYSDAGKRISKRETTKLLKKIIVTVGDSDRKMSTLVVGHNMTLGKNPTVTLAFNELARTWKKTPFVNLIHDLLEDGRYTNIKMAQKALGSSALPGALYPSIPNMHFAVINSKDYANLKKSGFPSAKLHFIPNSVQPERLSPLHPFIRMEAFKKLWINLESYCNRERFTVSASKKILLYPVRILKRKNMLEAMLLTYLLGKDRWQLWISLNPQGAESSIHWKGIKNLLPKLTIDILPGFGDFFVSNQPQANKITLNEQYNIADAVITTSVQEGFGFAFLEPWLAGKQLSGRLIKGKSDDFIKKGLDFSHLYRDIMIPADWVDLKKVAKKYAERIALISKITGRKVPAATRIEKTILKEKIRKGAIDFADLDVESQIGVIFRVNREGPAKILASNKNLKTKLSRLEKFPPRTIKKNAEIIRKEYGPQKIGKLWLKVAKLKPTRKAIPKTVHSKLLDVYNQPGDLRLIT